MKIRFVVREHYVTHETRSTTIREFVTREEAKRVYDAVELKRDTLSTISWREVR